jgi:hypothetical protein
LVAASVRDLWARCRSPSARAPPAQTSGTGVHAPLGNLNLPRSSATSTNPLAPDRRPATRHSSPAYCLRCATSSTTMSGATDYIQQYGRFRYSVTYGVHHDVQPPTQRASRSWTKRSATSTRNPTGTSGADALTGFRYRSPSHDPAPRVHPMPPRVGWPSSRGRPQLEDGLVQRQGGADHQIHSSQHAR